MTHLREHLEKDKLGRDRPLKSLWVPDLKEYREKRMAEGATPATINRETAPLSKLFSVMIAGKLIENNPVRLVKALSEESGKRHVYLSRESVQAVADHCPAWYQPILWTAYYTGMRRGEILGLAS